MRAALIALSLALWPGPAAIAANFTLVASISDPVSFPFPAETVGEYFTGSTDGSLARYRHIRMEGVIQPGDAERLLAVAGATDQFGDTILSMNSPGGNFAAGIALADAISQLSLTTYVGPGDSCLSACAFAWLGGQVTTIRGVAYEPARLLHVEGTLGFHTPKLDGSVPAAVLTPEAVEVLASEFARPTLANMKELQVRAGRWKITPDFLFEVLGRVGEDQFFFIDRWHEAHRNQITIVGPPLPPVAGWGIVEAMQGCGLVAGISLWAAMPEAPAMYFTGSRDDWLPGAEYFRTALRDGGISVLETPGAGPTVTWSFSVPSRGTMTCTVTQADGALQVALQGDLPTDSRIMQVVQNGTFPVNRLTILGFGIPWSAVGARDLEVRGIERLWEGVPEGFVDAAARYDYCTGAAAAQTWPVVCRFATLHKALQVLTVLTEAARASGRPGADDVYQAWTQNIGLYCRSGSLPPGDATAEMFAGYCGLLVTQEGIRQVLAAWYAPP